MISPIGSSTRRSSRGSRAGAVALSALLLVLLTTALPRPAAAQEYRVLGEVEALYGALHYRDAFFVSPAELRNTWEPYAELRAALTHRISGEGAEAVVDHRVRAVGANPGTLFGSLDPAILAVRHELIQGYLSIFVSPELTLGFGRQRLAWGMNYTASVTDALHPGAPDRETDVGFDGVSISFFPSPDNTLIAALAVQDAVTTGEMERLRAALYARSFTGRVETALSVVVQTDAILRPGAGITAPIGPLLFSAEVAGEMRPPTGSEWKVAPLGAVGIEARWENLNWALTAISEYRLNGLSDTAPEAGNAPPRTTDNAGGFDLNGRHHLFVSGAADYRSRVSTEHSVWYNISDGGMLFEHRVGWAAFPIAELTGRAVWPWGDSQSRFGTTLEDFWVEFGAKVSF